jgi:hypothetical protein
MRKIIRSCSVALVFVGFFFGWSGLSCAQSATAESAAKQPESAGVTPIANTPAPRAAPFDEQRPAIDKPQQFILFERPGAPGKINVDKLRESLKLAAQELHTPADILPGTIVFHISESEAELFGVKSTSIWRTGRKGGIGYEFWFVGEPTDADYSGLAVVLLEDHFNVSLDPTEGKRAVLAVTKKLRGMVSAEELGFNKSTVIESVPPPARGFVATSASYPEKNMPLVCHP